MADIFISYASKDRSRVEPLAHALEARGWSVWWDRTIPPGKSFDQVIEEAITAARCVVVLWSKKSIRSDWVKEEAGIGKRGKILVPAKIDLVEPPLGFGLIQAADLTDWKTDTSHTAFASFLSAISDIVGPPPQQEKGVQSAVVPESSLEQQLEDQHEEGKTPQATPRRPEPIDVKPPEPKHDATAPSEPRPFEPRKTGNALKFGVLAGVVVLMIAGIWWWFSQPQMKEVRQEMEKLNRQAVNLENAVAELDKPEQIEELYRHRDTLSDQVEGFSAQATKVGLRSELEELQNRLEQIQIQLGNKEKELFTTRRGKIFVVSAPDNAIVKILNIDEHFQQGMELEPGKYHVEVSSEGYEPQEIWIQLSPGEEKQVNFELKKITRKVAWLQVETVPEDASVRILNIKPKFVQGMELEPGRYHVEVAAEGYGTQRRWVDLVAGHEEPLRFELAKITVLEQISPDSPSPLKDDRVWAAIRILLAPADQVDFENARRLLWEAGYPKSIALSKSQLRLDPEHEKLLIERLEQIGIEGIQKD